MMMPGMGGMMADPNAAALKKQLAMSMAGGMRPPMQQVAVPQQGQPGYGYTDVRPPGRPMVQPVRGPMPGMAPPGAVDPRMIPPPPGNVMNGWHGQPPPGNVINGYHQGQPGPGAAMGGKMMPPPAPNPGGMRAPMQAMPSGAHMRRG